MDFSKAATLMLWLSASNFSYHIGEVYFAGTQGYLAFGIALFCLFIYISISIACFKDEKKLLSNEPVEFFLIDPYVVIAFLVGIAIYNIGFFEWAYITNIYIKYIIFILCSSISFGALFGSLTSWIMLKTCWKHKTEYSIFMKSQ